MTLQLIMTPGMIVVYSYLVVAAMAIGFISWLRISDFVRLAIVMPVLSWLIES